MTSTLRNTSVDGVLEYRISLSQLKKSSKSAKAVQKSSNSIEDQLLNKFKNSKEKIDKKRLKKQASDLQKLKFIPNINEKSNKLISSRQARDIEKLMEKMKKPSKSPEKQADPPAVPINPPDLSSVINMFNSRSYLKKEKIVKKINPNVLSIVDKGKFYQNKLKHDRSEAEMKKNQDLMKECTFKPDLSKNFTRAKSLETMNEILLTCDKSKLTDKVFQPAPNPQGTNSPLKVLSKLTMEDKVYAFKEGINLSKLLEKAKPILSYNSKAG